MPEKGSTLTSEFKTVTMGLILICFQIPLFAATKDSLIYKEISTYLNNTFSKGDIPGMSVIILHKEKDFILNYGYADKDSKVAVNSTTLFELGSCSKAFTALAALKLAKQNVIDLDKSVNEYLPWFRVTYRKKPVSITLRQLLHHTSGIPWSTIAKISPATGNNALECTVRKLTGQPLNNPPGKKFEYATINYDVVALIVQQVTGQLFETYLQQNVFDPLNLTSTTIGNPVDIKRMSAGYKLSFLRPRLYQAPVFRGNYAAGYVISDAQDIRKWLKFQMGMVPSTLYDLARSTQQRDESVAIHDMASYGMGWQSSLDGSNAIFHGGTNPNFTSYIIVRPDRQTAVAVLANSNSGEVPIIANRIMRLLFEEEIEREFRAKDGNDGTFSLISLLLASYLLILLVYLIYIYIQIIRKKRLYSSAFSSHFKRFGVALACIVPLLYGLYLLPEAMGGFTWSVIMIWMPGSFSILAALLLVTIALTYFVYLFSLIFPEKNEFKRLAPQILLISILSGMSNMLLITLITASFESTVPLKYQIYYYLLTFLVYIFGRKFVQRNLILVSRGLVFEIRMKLIQKIFSTTYQKFETVDRGRIYTGLNDDVDTIGEALNTFVMVITSVFTVTGAFIYLSSISFGATMLTLVIIAIISTIYYFVGRSTNRYFEEARETKNIFIRLLNGMIEGFKELGLHRNKKQEYKMEMAATAEDYKVKASTANIRFLNAFLIGESLLIIQLGIVAFFIPIIFPQIAFYSVISFVVVLLYLIGPVNGILSAVPYGMQLKVAWLRTQKLLNDIPSALDVGTIMPLRESNVKSFRAENIVFRFASKENTEAFEIGPINLEVLAGEALFIIGGNGSGKTTLAKLLTGLYEPSGGKLLINNCVTAGPGLSEYFSVVFSPLCLFPRLYNINVTEKAELIEHYLQVLCLRDKVTVKDGSYNTIELSGGQKKRLGLLQCYLEDAPIFLFDEWAADQDPSYRHFFYRTLLPEMKASGKIIIAITHDDHYFDVADKILKIDSGRLESYTGNSTSSAGVQQ